MNFLSKKVYSCSDKGVYLVGYLTRNISPLRYFANCLFILLALSSGCKTLQKAPSEVQNPSPAWSSDNNGILFIQLMVSGEQVGEPQQIELIDATIRDGRIKQSGPTEHLDPSCQIITQIMDCEGTLRQEESFPNPLLKNIEFVNDNGRFERKIISLDVEEMFLRLQVLPDDCKIKIGIKMMDNPGLLSTVDIDLSNIDYQDN